MPIEFAIFDHVECKTGLSTIEVYEHRLASLKKAEAGGFHAFHLAEHHGHTLSAAPTASVFLAAVARETTTMKLIPTVICLPLHNPVRLFEDLAMVDVLSHGRLELGIGKGITPFEHLQFGHDPEEASERAREMQTMLLRAWETGIMSSEGSKYYDFLELKLPFELLQKPYPPLWTAGNVETAGRGGNNFVYPYTMTPEVRARYDELWEASKSPPDYEHPHVTDPWIAQCQGVFIADTVEEAERRGREVWAGYSPAADAGPRPDPAAPPGGGPRRHGQPGGQGAAGRRTRRGAASASAARIETVTEYYVEQARRGLANYFMLMLPFGQMTLEEADSTLDAFIDHIIPAVRATEAEMALTPA